MLWKADGAPSFGCWRVIRGVALAATTFPTDVSTNAGSAVCSVEGIPNADQAEPIAPSSTAKIRRFIYHPQAGVVRVIAGLSVTYFRTSRVKGFFRTNAFKFDQVLSDPVGNWPTRLAKTVFSHSVRFPDRTQPVSLPPGKQTCASAAVDFRGKPGALRSRDRERPSWRNRLRLPILGGLTKTPGETRKAPPAERRIVHSLPTAEARERQ